MKCKLSMIAVAVCLAAALVGCGGYGSEETVTVEVTGVSDDEQKEFVKSRLQGLLDAGFTTSSSVSVGQTMTIKLAPVEDAKAFAEKINVGEIVSVSGRTIKLRYSESDAAQASKSGDGSGASDSATAPNDPGSAIITTGDGKKLVGEEDAVTVKVTGVSGEAQWESIEKQLSSLITARYRSTSTSYVGQTTTVKVAPVKDVDAFVKGIDFGKIESVDGRNIKVRIEQ